MMPEFTYCMSLMAWHYLPIVIILFNLQGFVLIDKVEQLAPFMAFTIIIETVILV